MHVTECCLGANEHMRSTRTFFINFFRKYRIHSKNNIAATWISHAIFMKFLFNECSSPTHRFHINASSYQMVPAYPTEPETYIIIQ